MYEFTPKSEKKGWLRLNGKRINLESPRAAYDFTLKRHITPKARDDYANIIRDWGFAKGRQEEQYNQKQQLIQYSSANVIELSKGSRPYFYMGSRTAQGQRPTIKAELDESDVTAHTAQQIEFSSVTPLRMHTEAMSDRAFQGFEQKITSAKLSRLRVTRVNHFFQRQDDPLTVRQIQPANRALTSSSSARSFSSRYRHEKLGTPKVFSDLYRIINNKQIMEKELMETKQLKERLSSAKINISLKTLKKSLETPQNLVHEYQLLPHPGEGLSQCPVFESRQKPRVQIQRKINK